MAFHFPLMPRMFMGVRLEDRKPITEILQQTPPIPDGCQWCLFLRNHDELTLEMVTDLERDYMYDEYARDRSMRLNVGIRRRLAPLLENDRRRIELMNGLLMSLARNSHHLLRRRNRHGRQRSSRRSQQRSHSHAMGWKLECGLLRGRSREFIFGFDSQSGLRLSGRERRVAAAFSSLSAFMDAASHSGSQIESCFWTWLDRILVSGKPSSVGFPPSTGK